MIEPANSTLYRTFLLVTLPIVGLMGLALRVSALWILSISGLALLAGAWIAARRNVRRIDIRREVYPSAFEDDRVDVDLVVENTSSASAQLVEIADQFEPAIADRQLMMEAGPLRGHRRRRLSYTGTCSRHWGVYTLGPIEVRAADATGLFHAKRVMPQIDPFSVFPRVHEVPSLERLGAMSSLTPQDASAGRPGQGGLFLGARDYRPGDDARRIHWPATARRGSPVVKEFEVDLVPYFSLFLDLDRAHRAGTGKRSALEYVMRFASSLVWTAVRRGDLVQIFGEGAKPLFVPPGRGDVHLAVALQELIQIEQNGDAPLLEAVERHLPHVPPGSTAALLSATILVELAAVGEAIEALRSRGVRPLLIFVNSTSFTPVDKWPLPRAEAVERCREIEYFLRSRGVPGTIVGAEHDLEQELARPDLFWGRS